MGVLRLENLVMQARDPIITGGSGRPRWDYNGRADPDDYEGWLNLGDSLFLDICIERVTSLPPPHPRLHPDLLGGARKEQQHVVERLPGLGARHLGIGQHGVTGAVLW